MAKHAKSITPTGAASATPATAPVANAVTTALRLPLAQAQAHNAQVALVPQGATPTAAPLARTARGTNAHKARVYGYANASNGMGVPRNAVVLLVPGFTGCPRGVNAGQWAALVAAVGLTPNATVAVHYANGISSRTVRRAFRAGAIAFGASA